jgi:hypothetical protein
VSGELWTYAQILALTAAATWMTLWATSGTAIDGWATVTVWMAMVAAGWTETRTERP